MKSSPAPARGPAFAFGILLAVVPPLAVLQFRALALAISLGLLAVVLVHRRQRGSWPWPSGPLLWAALALFGWVAITAAWAAEPWRALGTGARGAGFVLLAAGAAEALRQESPDRLRFTLRCLMGGLACGIGLALADHLTGNAIRAGVRGLKEVPPQLAFGLKPAVSVLAVMLPLAVALPSLPRWGRAVLALAGIGTALLLPGDSAKLAAVAGVGLALACCWIGPRLGVWLGGAVAVAILAMPLAMASLTPRLHALEGYPPSAVHRILIWDFVTDRIAEHPVLGWGAEASRTIPGGRDRFDTGTLDRFGLTSPASRAWFGSPTTQRVPLHTHNAPLQIWLELGLAGALLAAGLAWMLGRAAAGSALPAAAAGALGATGIVGLLSFGIWQEWWIGVQLLLVVTLAALGRLASAR